MLEGRYILTADNHIRFDVSGYDKAKPLVIDPVLVYSTFFGIGEDHMGSSAIAVDSSGYAYIAGWGPVPVTTGAFQTTTNNYEPAFVTKFDPTGSTLAYSTYLGGSQPTNQSFGIAVDSTGNAYVTGDTDSSDFPTTPGSFQANPLNGQCSATTCNTKIFVTKLSATGNGLVYATYLDGNADDHSRGIALDAADNVYLTGYTDSTSFPTTSGAFQTAYGGGSPGYNALSPS